MTPWELFRTSDAAVVLTGIAGLAGYVCGMAVVVVACWGRLREKAPAATRLLRATLEDRNAELSKACRELDQLRADCREQTRVINAQTGQIGQLYRDCDRMAEHYVDALLEVQALREGLPNRWANKVVA